MKTKRFWLMSFFILLLGGFALSHQQLKPPSNLTATVHNKKKLTIVTTSLPVGQVGVPYNFQLQATGGTPPYHWSISSGSLPPGLTISEGIISGTPLVAGDYGMIKVKP